MLRIEELHVFYGNIEAVKGVSFNVKHGEIATLIGANGAGKTTLMSAIMGLIPVKSGRIYFKNTEITNKPAERIVSLGLSLVPEGRKIFNKLSVKENLQLGGFSKKNNNISDNIENIYTLFPVLKERQKQLGGTLSGGEQQMLAIARSLMSEPEMLLLDEPSLGLSPIMEQLVFKMIKSINESGTTVLLVEQNANLALKVSKKGYVMETGNKIIEGDSMALLSDPKVRKAYLGE